MDTTKTTTHVSLCAGYGGIDLGLGRAIPDLRTIAFSEIEAFACSNLVSKMEAGLLDAAPIWTNLKTFPWSEFRDRVDILSGGYPCQPFSAAGKRLGRDDPRHLWPWIADGIRAMRPRVCFFENVEGHISLGLREVISELEGIGYKTTWGIFSAREVGAPHQRKRVFILAKREGEYGWRLPIGANATAWPSRPGQPQHEWEPPRVVTGRETLDDSESGDLRLNRNDQRTTDRESNAAYITSNGGGEGEAASMGNAKHDGSHQCDSEARGEIIGSKQGRMQELEGGSSSVGDTEHDGLHGATPGRCYEADARSWSEEESEVEQQRQRAGVMGSEIRTIMGNTSNWSNGQQPTEQQGWNTSGRSSEESGAMGNTQGIRSSACGTEHEGLGGELCLASSGDEGVAHTHGTSSGINGKYRRQLGLQPQGGANRRDERDTERTENGIWQVEPEMGRDSDGSSYRMDDAELFVTSDNRTDELRLLGNGVVPATAERAFLILMDQLLSENP